MTDGSLKFVIFYIIFVSLTLTFTAYMDLSVFDIDGMPEALKDPTLNILNILPKFYFLVTLSALPEFWFLGIFITALNFGMVYVILKALPFT